jgi:hypothetical protein
MWVTTGDMAQLYKNMKRINPRKIRTEYWKAMIKSWIQVQDQVQHQIFQYYVTAVV